MKLLRCHVENFGILSDFDLTFTEGLNVLCRENGFGKSTLAAFLKAMFYGLPKTRAKASERKRYDPWQGGKYGGFLEFEYRGNQYRVTRYFEKKEDSFSLTDLTNRAESTAFSEKLGEELFRLDADSFARSTFVPQLSDREITATTSIRAKLTNLVEDTNDLNNFDTAMKKLQEYRKELKLYRGEGGQIARLRRECRELEASIHTAAEKKEPLGAVCWQIDALNLEKTEKMTQQAFLREQIRQSSAQKALRLQQENLEQLRGQVQGREKELSNLDAEYPKGYPSMEALRFQQENLARAAHARQRVERRANADASGLSEEEKTRLEALTRQFSQGIPGEEELEAWERMRQKRDTLLESRNADCFSAREQADYQALAKTFAQGTPDDAQIREAQRQCGRIEELQNSQSTETKGPGKKRDLFWLIFGLVSAILGLLLKVTIPGICAMALGVGALIWTIADRIRTSRAAANAVAENARAQEDLRRQLNAFLGHYALEGATPEEKLAALLADRQRYLELSGRKADWADRRSRTETQLLQVQSDLRQVFDRFYPGECYDDAFLKNLREALETYRRLNWRIAENRKRWDTENAQDWQEAKQAVETVRDFLEEYDLIGDTESECLEKAETDLHRRKLLCGELENAKKALDDFLKKNGDVGSARQDALPEAEVLERQERLIQDRLDELEQELQQARAQRKNLQASVECIPEWEDRLTALQEDLREAERKCDLTDRTMALLEKAKDALANSYMDKIEQGFQKYTGELLPRQLGDVMVDRDLQPHIDVQGAAREVESFSAGLADSILLCMRLALVDALFGEESPFLILDDPFVNLDDEHTRRALALLQKMAEKHQILYLVCNTSRV